MNEHVHADVPTELLVQVLVGQLDEHEAIERGRRAAGSTTAEERRAILFAEDTIPAPAPRPPSPRCGPLPWFEP